MKPLTLKTEDQDSLQTLGRASAQIVHDLKNQLNGLKLYATFLRKRMEKGDRPQDEHETVVKLLAGLERAASDLSTLTQFGRPIELKRQQGVDLQKIMRSVAASLAEPGRITGPLTGQLTIETTPGSVVGEFDPVMLADALRAISIGALRIRQLKDRSLPLHVRITRDETASTAIIEFLGIDSLDHDPFAAFAGSDEIRMSLAAKVVGAHGGTADHQNNTLRVCLPIAA